MRDKWFRLIGIPVIGIVMPAILTGTVISANRTDIANLLISFIATISMWEGNRFIMTHIRHWLSWEKEAMSRMTAQLLVSVLYTILVVVLICKVVTPVLGGTPVTPDILRKAIFGSVLITLMIIAIYESIYFSRRWRMSIMRNEVLKRQNLISEFESLKHQVNPHFLFNSLNTLTHLIESDKSTAVRFVQHMASVYRYVLQGKEGPLVEMEKEVRFVEMYIFLLMQRFTEGLEIDIAPEVKQSRTLIPPLTLQILVENAVKHNIIGKERPLHVQVYIADGQLVVTNNLQKKSVLEKYTKIGLRNIKERYHYLVDKPVEIIQDALNFTVFLPLIRVEDARL